MLRTNNYEGRIQVSVHSLDEHVPKHHLVCKIENANEFNSFTTSYRIKHCGNEKKLIKTKKAFPNRKPSFQLLSS